MDSTPNQRPQPLPALEIVTSSYLAICVRVLTIPIGIATIILAGLVLSSHTKQPFHPFLITVITSLGLNIIDTISLCFEIWGPPINPPANNPRISSHQYEMRRNSYRASPRWRGIFDLAVLVALVVTVFGMNKCHDLRLPCRRNDGKVSAAQYLGVMIACGHLWLCSMAVLESFLKHWTRGLQARNAG